ncbi:MAG TPA: glycosyltransferase [Trebonia sp.]|jgi:hypothetical protein|nr:glycosyltransferase [Trebonia sp.]
MRILIGSDSCYPQIDGTSYFTQRLAAGLAGHGHDVHVLCPADPAIKGTPQKTLRASVRTRATAAPRAASSGCPTSPRSCTSGGSAPTRR